ncbi:hypothetical protein P171DRAFT_491973 [Karstenula rhodostoma CBS 690.94]|uniref:Uncharacterized protein n=1 Tax=Karstenula rhodostoma CBS 690.94 TaxID=1392251 RepID=A0A9P4U5E1_9PLEO|nr:hypothetical protein P171DRAFT_491973 [Karstenula rhodostoma CBS 690.94]
MIKMLMISLLIAATNALWDEPGEVTEEQRQRVFGTTANFPRPMDHDKTDSKESVNFFDAYYPRIECHSIKPASFQCIVQVTLNDKTTSKFCSPTNAAAKYHIPKDGRWLHCFSELPESLKTYILEPFEEAFVDIDGMTHFMYCSPTVRGRNMPVPIHTRRLCLPILFLSEEECKAASDDDYRELERVTDLRLDEDYMSLKSIKRKKDKYWSKVRRNQLKQDLEDPQCSRSKECPQAHEDQPTNSSTSTAWSMHFPCKGMSVRQCIPCVKEATCLIQRKQLAELERREDETV